LSYNARPDAGVAQSVEQLICNQPVGGSNPLTSSILKRLNVFVKPFLLAEGFVFMRNRLQLIAK
jgi:hypothetical protein